MQHYNLKIGVTITFIIKQYLKGRKKTKVKNAMSPYIHQFNPPKIRRLQAYMYILDNPVKHYHLCKLPFVLIPISRPLLRNMYLTITYGLLKFLYICSDTYSVSLLCHISLLAAISDNHNL